MVLVRTREYTCWLNMKQRCYNPNHPEYFRYGAKGIKVCERWLECFENFFKDMGKIPDGESLDRIDCFGNYEPNNCRLANKTIQSYNRKKSDSNSSGKQGVSWCKQTNRWKDYITKQGKQITIGRFKDKEDAISARIDYEIKLYGGAKC